MTKGLAFRNIEASPDDPVSEWPLEGIQAALKRGGLEHWHRLAGAIQAEPWGPVARRVEQVLAYSRPYGVAAAMERVISGVREEAEASERKAVAAEVDALVHRSGLSRAEFASRIGTSASRLSTYTTGKVTPSAALLVRMRRVLNRWSKRAEAEAAGELEPGHGPLSSGDPSRLAAPRGFLRRRRRGFGFGPHLLFPLMQDRPSFRSL